MLKEPPSFSLTHLESSVVVTSEVRNGGNTGRCYNRRLLGTSEVVVAGVDGLDVSLLYRRGSDHGLVDMR